MTKYRDLQIGDLFQGMNGRAKFIKDYIAKNAGPHHVYSASLVGPFGLVNEYDYDGHFLTWVMNGYGGRVQEIKGKFAANRDRGVLVPRSGVRTPDLTYLRFVMEPLLIAAAVGRRVDGRQNDYTKIYPDTAEAVTIRLPLDEHDEIDYSAMITAGAKFRKIEEAKAAVLRARDSLNRAAFATEIVTPSASVAFSDEKTFELSIGKRVLCSEHTHSGIPVYSANALVPFGRVSSPNLNNFDRPSLLWGIDGNFDWNLIPQGEAFATTDHCGRLQVLSDDIDPEYIYWILKATRASHGFDRVYRASLGNIKAEVSIPIPLEQATGKFSMKRQRELAALFRERERSKRECLSALDDVLSARISPEA